MPRHPPCALLILTVSPQAACIRSPAGLLPIIGLCAVFKRRRGRTAGVSRSRSLRTEQRNYRNARGVPAHLKSSRHFQERRPAIFRWTADSESRGGLTNAPSLLIELPRKEVIQPQLPLRLPCYDFTPITSPTFDGCLPKGLAHRLRVLPAFVV